MKDFKNFKLPKIRAVKPGVIAQEVAKVQPFFDQLRIGETYLAKETSQDIWETCTMKDISDPDYKPFLAIPSKGGYAVWDVEKGIPIVCTDREIFKKFEPDPEGAIVTEENMTFKPDGHKNGMNSLVFYMDYKYSKGPAKTAIAIRSYAEFKKKFGSPSDGMVDKRDLKSRALNVRVGSNPTSGTNDPD